MITNAYDAMPEGGTFTIKTEISKDDQNVTMQFIDNGRGIEKEHLNKIFDPFFTTKTTLNGKGLGLSISHGIIQKHAGRISVTSEPGKGAHFKVYLSRET